MTPFRKMYLGQLTHDIVPTLTADEFLYAVEHDLAKFAGRLFSSGTTAYQKYPDDFNRVHPERPGVFPELLDHITNTAYCPTLWREAQHRSDFRVLRPITNVDEVIAWSPLEVVQNTYTALHPAFLELQRYLEQVYEETYTQRGSYQQKHLDTARKYAQEIAAILAYMQTWLVANAEQPQNEGEPD